MRFVGGDGGGGHCSFVDLWRIMSWEEGCIIFCIIIIVGGSISMRCFLLGLCWVGWWIGGRCCHQFVVNCVFVVIRVCCCGGGGIRWVVLRERRERRGIGGIECVSKGIIHLADASSPFSPIGTGASVVVVVAMGKA